MSNPNAADEDEVEISLSTRQVAMAIVFGIVIMYFSATGTLYLQQSPAERSLLQLVYPFERGPSAKKLHRKGVQYFQEGQYGQATQFFARSIDKDPENSKGLFLMASAQAKQGKFDRALRQLQILDQGKINIARIPIKKAYWLLGLGRFVEARDAARTYIDRSPSRQNRVYGYLILYTIAHLEEKEPTPEQIRSKVKSLDLDRNDWPRVLFQEVTNQTKEDPFDDENRSRRTEYYAWRAMLSWMEGRDDAAREHRDWVLREGDASVYEYDLMLASRSSGLFDMNY